MNWGHTPGPGSPSWISGWGAHAPAAPIAPPPAAAHPAQAQSIVAGLPVDPVYDQAIANLARNRDSNLAGLEQQRTGGLFDYGYSPTYGAGGSIQSLQVDPANPYSRAAALQRNFDQHRAGNTTSMANSGQLYSGALINAQNANDQGFQQGTDSLQKAALAFLARNQQQKTGAQTAYEEGASQAAADRVSRASSSPLYDPDALAAMQDQLDKLTTAQTSLLAPVAAHPAAHPTAAPRVTSTSRQPTTRGGTRTPRPQVPLRRPVTRKPKAKTRH